MTVVDPGRRVRVELKVTEGDRVESVAGCACVLLTYSVTDRSSLSALQTVENVRPKSALILVGLKSDLRGEREVTDEEAEELAEKLHCAHICVSALQFTNVELLMSLMRIRTVEHLSFIEAKSGDSSSESDSEAESEAMLTVEVKMSAEKTVLVSVRDGDCAKDVAKKALRKFHVPENCIDELAATVQKSISAYCQSITHKPLYRVKLNCGAHTDSLTVHAGDDLPSLAASYSQSRQLPPALASQIEPLLRRSHEQFSKQRLALSRQATCVSLPQ